jgi:hypothetical protein
MERSGIWEFQFPGLPLGYGTKTKGEMGKRVSGEADIRINGEEGRQGQKVKCSHAVESAHFVRLRLRLQNGT